MTGRKVPVTDKLRSVNTKTVVAVVLMSVMAILWGRVLLTGKSGPAAASAQPSQPLQEPAAAPAASETLVAEPLKVLPGRHDRLAGDMFSAGRCETLNVHQPEPDAAQTPVAGNTLEQKHQANLNKLARTLKLEAVIRGADTKPTQVFVNDEILTVGSVLTVKEGPEHYELELKRIHENEAVFTWKGTSITLKMAQMDEK